MAYSTYLRNKLASAITDATHVSLHVSDPGDIGGNELSGGSPAYARVVISSWTLASTGVYQATLAGDFNVPANTTVTWAALWKDNLYIEKTPTTIITSSQTTVPIYSLTFEISQSSDTSLIDLA